MLPYAIKYKSFHIQTNRIFIYQIVFTFSRSTIDSLTFTKFDTITFYLLKIRHFSELPKRKDSKDEASI